MEVSLPKLPTVNRTQDDRHQQRSQSAEILAMLRAAGDRGCTNATLWTVAHAAHSRIADLRGRGHVITCTREAAGLYRYRLVEDPQVAGEASLRTWPTLPLFAAVGLCE
jgi:hypothetical protein